MDNSINGSADITSVIITEDVGAISMITSVNVDAQPIDGLIRLNVLINGTFQLVKNIDGEFDIGL